MEFKRDKNLLQSESFSSGPISKTGLYKGTITKGYVKPSKSSSSVSVHFDIVCDNGAYGQIDFWTNGKGEQNKVNSDNINALTVLLETNIKTEPGTIEVWDNNIKARVKQSAEVFPQVAGASIGMVWQMQEELSYPDEDRIIQRPVFLKFCHPETHQSAGEFYKKTEAKVVDEYVTNLAPVKILDWASLTPAQRQKLGDGNIVKQASNQPNASQNAQPKDPVNMGASNTVDDFDDDSIPF